MAFCRLCASTKKAERLIHIKDQSNEICQKLQKCCRISIHMSDAMPKSVCQPCLDQLNVSYNFYSKVQEAQETLKSLFLSKQCNEGPIHTTKESMSTEENVTDPVRHQEMSLRIKMEIDDFGTQVTLKPLFRSQQVDQRSGNKVDPGVGSLIKSRANYITSKQSPTAETEETTQPVKHQQTSLCEIKIEKEDVEYLKQEVDGNHDTMFSIGNVSIADDVSNSDNDDYLREIYGILGLPHDGVGQGSTSEEHKPTDCWVSTIVKEEEVVQEGQYGTFLETTTPTVQIESNFEEIDEYCSQHTVSWKSYKHHCPACDHSSVGFEDLIAHANAMHSISDKNKLRYICYDCQKVLEDYTDFLNHVRLKHHPALKLRCDACDMLCTDHKQYELHRNVNCVEAQKFPIIFTCPCCCKTFRTVDEKKQHIKQYYQPKRKCKLCSRECSSQSALTKHEKSHKSE